MALALRVRLDSDGGLEVESVDGRWLTLREVDNETWQSDPIATLKYILREAADGQVAIGRRGNPTSAQLKWIEEHGLQDWNDPPPAPRYPMGKTGRQVRAASERGQLRVSASDLEDLI